MTTNYTGVPGYSNYYFDGYTSDFYTLSIQNYLQPLADVGVSRVSPGFVRLLQQYDPRAIRKVVETNFPQWLEELDKLLVIK